MTAEQERAVRDAERKRIVKEAISEWLDAKFAVLGRWSLGGIAAAALALLAYLLMVKAGWSPPT